MEDTHRLAHGSIIPFTENYTRRKDLFTDSRYLHVNAVMLYNRFTDGHVETAE
jgi:hypothetical protein